MVAEIDYSFKFIARLSKQLCLESNLLIQPVQMTGRSASDQDPGP